MNNDIFAAQKNEDISEEVRRAKQRFSIIGNSPALINAIDRALKVAPVDLAVLVIGESGSGKEFFPRIIHNSGARKHKKFIAVNCGAIPEGTIDSELFGHEKGSFTGAVSSRKGYFEEADGGTIFLDEVAELPLTTQARLLRVLESGEFLKVGSSQTQLTDVRIVAATNVDLLEAVRKGKFRQDLYYRLSTVIINVPNLHDRGDDIILLARKFAADFAEKYMTSPISFSEEARHALLLYRWPGNVRQLKNCVEQLALFKAGKEISNADLLQTLPSRNNGNPPENSFPCADRHNYEQERDLLWQSLFALRNEVAEIKHSLLRKGILSETESFEKSPLLTTLPPRLPENRLSAKELLSADEQAPDSSSHNHPLSLEEAEKIAIQNALKLNNGDKKLAAEQLNISQRTLYRKINEYGITL